jgi:hypothetical protein
MNFKKKLIKLLENKNVYYVVLALSVIHLILYIYNKHYKAVSFFVLSAIIIYNFNKNSALVLLLSLIATHFFVAGNSVYEGLENKDETKAEEEKNGDNIDKLQGTDSELANAATKVSETQDKEEESKIKDPNNPDLNISTSGGEEPVPESFDGGKKGTVRLDHAATIESAYDDLQNILGSDGINKLTDDTKKLMSQQKNLFNAMNELAPAVKETMSMLEGLDLNGISNMSSSASEVSGKLQNLMRNNNIKQQVLKNRK